MILPSTSFLFLTLLAQASPTGPYETQFAENLGKLTDESSKVRAGAAEALGFLRAYRAEAALVRCLEDVDRDVRRQAVMALACAAVVRVWSR